MGSDMVAATAAAPFGVIKNAAGVCPLGRCASIDPGGCAVPLVYSYRPFCAHAHECDAGAVQSLPLGSEVFAVGPLLFPTYFNAFRWAFNHPQSCQRLYWLRKVACGWEALAYCGEVGRDAQGPERFQGDAAEVRAVLFEVRRRADSGARCLAGEGPEGESP